MRRLTKFVRGFTLIEIVVVLAIIALLATAFTIGTRGGKSPRKDGRGTTVPGLVKAKAEDEVCRSNLRQVRAGIMVFQTSNDDQFPQALTETKIGNEFYKCPMGGEPYVYDPQSGQVHCPHPGHEKF